MTSEQASDDQEVSDFLMRIKELGEQRNREDEERARKLEEEILAGREARRAKREERARSLSPQKNTPISTARSTIRNAAAPAEQLKLDFDTPLKLTRQEEPAEEAVRTEAPAREDVPERVNPSDTPSTSSEKFTAGSRLAATTTPIQRSLATPGSKPLSWQRRPQSMFSERPAFTSTTPTHFAKTISPLHNTEAKSVETDDGENAREQISKNLSSKDPAWFRQTADRNATSGALRKDAEGGSTVTARFALPGMSNPKLQTPEPVKPDVLASKPTTSSSTKQLGPSPFEKTPLHKHGKAGSTPFDNLVRLHPTPTRGLYPDEEEDDEIDENDDEDERRAPSVVSVSSHASESSTRTERPPSPTKGLGGFVQSAMLKREGSVRKDKWGTTSPSVGLARAGTTTTSSWVAPRKDHFPSRLSRESTPVMDGDDDDKMSRGRSAMSPSAVSTISYISEESYPERKEPSPPASPTKTFNQRRWSPIKSSWLETALQKGAESPSFGTSNPSQPLFASSKDNRSPTRENSFKRGEISPTRQDSTRREERARARLAGQSVPRKMSVESNSEASVKSGSSERGSWKANIQPKPTILSPKSVFEVPSSTSSVSSLDPEKLSNAKTGEQMKPPVAHKPLSLAKPASDIGPLDKPSVNLSNKPVFERGMPGSTIKDPLSIRAGLRAAQPSTSEEQILILDAKTKLRASKTENYRAPDELKETILAGKSNLAAKGGPQNYRAPDELKETILAGKSNLASKGGPQNYRAPDELKEKVLAARGNLNESSGPQNYKPPDELKEIVLAARGNLSRSSSPTKQLAPDPLKENIMFAKGSLRASGNPLLTKTSGKPSVPAKPALAKNFFTPPESDRLSEKAEKDETTSPITEEVGMPVVSKQISAPGRIQKPVNSLAERFNPNLVGIFSRGAPGPGHGIQKAATMGGISSDSSEPKDGPQLTHMTKARARGPKRRAPAADTVPDSATTASATNQKATETVKSKIFQPSQVLDLPSLTSRTNRTFHNNNVNKATPPTTPNKPSNFSMKSSIEDDISSQKSTPTEKLKPPTPAKSPLLTTKNAKSSAGTREVTSDREVSSPPPETPAHTIPFTTSTLPTLPTPLPLFSTPRKLPIPPTSAGPGTNDRVTPSLPTKAKPQRQPNVEDVPDEDDQPVNVKQAATKWGSTNSTPEGTPARKGLKRLTSYQEEIAAMESSRSTMNASPVNQEARSPQPKLAQLTPVKDSGAVENGSFLSDPNKFLAQFFNGEVTSAPDFDIDVENIILMRPTKQEERVITLKKIMWEITGINGKKDLVPSGQENILYEDGLYLCLHSYMEDNGMMASEIFMWSGEKVSSGTVEEAQLSAKKLAREYEGRLTVLQQGKEVPNFIGALGGVVITRRGSRATLYRNIPYALCCRRVLGGVALDEVDMHYSSLCAGFPYIFVTADTVYLWKGRGASAEELGAARHAAIDLAGTGEVREFTEGKESKEFLELIGGDAEEQAHADFWKLKPQYPQYTVRAFLVDHTLTGKISEIRPFCQSDLETTNIYVVDAFFEMYIVLGANSQEKRHDFQLALQFTHEYSSLVASTEKRPFIPVSTVILGGAPREFKALFRRWQDSKMMTDWQPSRKPSLRLMVGLTQAMDLMKV